MFGLGMGRMGGSGQSGGGTIWTPAELYKSSEQGAWYDPSDWSTLFQDSAGTLPVTAAGQQVGRMLDKSGGGYHMLQPVTINRPILQIDGAGKYYLAFNGTNSWMSVAAMNFSGSDKLMVGAGLRHLSDVAGMVLELSASVNTNAGAAYLVTGNDSGIGYHAQSRGSASIVLGQAARATAFNAPRTAIVTATHDIVGSLSTIRQNGVAGVNGAVSKGTGNFGNYPLYLGARAGSSVFFSGQLYGLILRGALPTTEQAASLETYLNNKTGAY